MNLIALVGFIGSGKDTVGRHLVESHGFYDMAFADALKDACAAMFCWDREMLDGKSPQSREWRNRIDPWWAERLGVPGFTPRWALQNVGTEIMRGTLHDDLWLFNAERRIIDLIAQHGPTTNIVLTDCRFPNELKMVRALGGRIVRVRRGDDPEWFDVVRRSTKNGRVTNAEAEPPTRDLHVSEWAWISEDMDYTIDNDTGLDRLYTKVDELVEQTTRSTCNAQDISSREDDLFP